MSGEKQFDFSGLRTRLEEETFPMVYFFKFIVPGDNRSIARLEAIFDDKAQITLRSSKNGKYTSLSAKEVMIDVDSVIDRYEKAMEIEGCVPL